MANCNPIGPSASGNAVQLPSNSPQASNHKQLRRATLEPERRRRFRIWLLERQADRCRLVLGDDIANVQNVLGNRMIREWINASIPQAFNKPTPSVLNPLPMRKAPDFAVRIEIDFIPFMTKPEPGWRHTGNNIVIVHPAVCLELDVVHIPSAANSRAAKGE